MNFKVFYDFKCPSVDIESEDFTYSNIKDFYKSGNGHGLQCGFDSGDDRYDYLLELCTTITDALYKYQNKMDSLHDGKKGQ